MDTIEVYHGEDKHEIEVKALTLLTHNCLDDFSIPSAVTITPEDTVRESENLSQESLDTLYNEGFVPFLFDICLPDHEFPRTLDQISKESQAVKHVLGMVYLTVQAIVANKRPFLRLPETYLPAMYHSKITDMFLLLVSGKSDVIAERYKAFMSKRASPKEG